MKARRKGTCPLCSLAFPKGSEIRRHSASWVHQECASIAIQTGRVISGATFAAGAGSTWRRGKSPSSSRSKM